MPVVTQFGELFLGDARALDMWLAAHNARHNQYVAQNIGVHGVILDGPVDGDWMFRHTAQHVALDTATKGKLGSAAIAGLALPGVWQNEPELDDWSQLHNRLHTLIDAALGIASHTLYLGARPTPPTPVPPGPNPKPPPLPPGWPPHPIP